MMRNKFNFRILIAMTICLAGMFFLLSCESPKKNLVKVSFEDKKYDVLYLIADTGDESLRIDGTSKDGYNWTFEISDSIVEITSHYEIIPGRDSLIIKNEDDVHLIEFRTIIENDTLRGSYFNFDKNKNLIDLKCKFDTTTSIEYTHFVLQTIVTDYFLMELPENTYLREYMLNPLFGSFYDKKDPDKTYEDFIVEYADKIKKNPNSLYYMSYLSKTPSFYKSKEDYENLFNLFSSEMQNSRWGTKAKMNFAPFKIEGINDIVLPNPLTKENEKIILEPAKYTLLCFSASWCGPCHKIMPLLKEIHEKTKDNLNMVYITTDKSDTIDDWNALMEKESIKWRSLWLTDTKLKSDWQISTIPDFILIDPDSNAKKILLKEEKDIQALYLLLNK